MSRQRTFSSEGCADAMVAAGYEAEAENHIDNGIIQQQHEEIERLKADMMANSRKLILANQHMSAALAPFALLAQQFDERVFPLESGGQRISTTLEDCRRARHALSHPNRVDGT